MTFMLGGEDRNDASDYRVLSPLVISWGVLLYIHGHVPSYFLVTTCRAHVGSGHFLILCFRKIRRTRCCSSMCLICPSPSKLSYKLRRQSVRCVVQNHFLTFEIAEPHNGSESERGIQKEIANKLCKISSRFTLFLMPTQQDLPVEKKYRKVLGWKC